MTTMFFIAGATAAIIVIETITAKLMGARWLALLVVPVANIVSLFAGLYIVGILFYLIEPMFGTHLIDTAAPAAWTTLAVLAVFGVLIEWPMMRLCFRGARPWKRSLFALLVGAGLSNLLLVVMAYNTYDHGLSTNFTRAPAAEIASEHRGSLPWVYYIDHESMAVWRIRLDGTGRERVCAIDWQFDGSDHDQPRVQIRAGASGDIEGSEIAPRLVVEFVHFGREGTWRNTIDPDLSGGAPYPQPVELDFDAASISTWDIERAPFQRLEGFADLRPEIQSDEEIVIWFGGTARYGEHSLKVFNPMVGHNLEASALTALPDGLAVFDFARYAVSDPPRGIMLISTRTMRRALLVEDGWCPVVVYEQQD